MDLTEFFYVCSDETELGPTKESRELAGLEREAQVCSTLPHKFVDVVMYLPVKSAEKVDHHCTCQGVGNPGKPRYYCPVREDDGHGSVGKSLHCHLKHAECQSGAQSCGPKLLHCDLH